MDHGGALADSADDLAAVHPLDQFVEIWVVGRICTDHGIFDRDAKALIDEPGDHIEACHSIGAHVGFVFEVEQQANIGSLGKLAQASFQAGRIARICAGKRHDTGEGKAA